MKNRKYMFIMAIILIVLIILVTVQGCMILNLKQEQNNDNNINSTTKNPYKITYSSTEDSKKIKEEYEALNGTSTGSDRETYNTVNISEENPINYVDLQELINIINSDEEAYIYMSSADCPYCRATIETLLQVVQDLGVEKLYYYDLSKGITLDSVDGEEKVQEITNILIEKGLVTRKEDGSNSWRIPLVAKTKSGEVLAKTIGTGVVYNEEQSKYSELTEEQIQEVYNEYYELLKD